jgi:hypothetical protein
MGDIPENANIIYMEEVPDSTIKTNQKTPDKSKKSRSAFLKITIFLSAFIMILTASSGQGITEEVKQESDRQYVSLFNSDELLDVSLYLDLSSYLKKADKNNSFDALMTMHFSDTDSVQSKVTISYRGQSRYERCKYPPMKIKFRKPLYQTSESGRIKSMKLVNQCQQGYASEEYVIRECLVYKLYEVLTDTCYRTRLVKISFNDTERKRKPLVQYGIFIEPDALLASRTNTLEARTGSVRQSHMIPSMIDRIAVFNYMVSNWDWAVVSQHNIRVFVSSQYGQSMLGIPVPFDFDLAGVVNADYAIPPPWMTIKTNRDRIFSGICRSEETYRHTLMMFLDKKDDLYAVVNDFPYLARSAKRDITWFLDQFFDQLEKEKSLDKLIDTFLQTCSKQ